MTKRIVILSPHPDDAVWSLGGAMSVWGEEADVLVVSVFDGDATAEALSLHKEPQNRWRGAGQTALRRREDQSALDLLFCSFVGLGHRDAGLRMDSASQFECENPDALFLPPEYQKWPDPPVTMQAQLVDLLRPDDTLVAPLALGRHIDHCVVHKLARYSGAAVCYYAEFPYLLSLTDDLCQHMSMLGLSLQQSTIHCDWGSWLKAASRYRSQVLRMFGSHRQFAEQLADYGHSNGTDSSCLIWSTR